MSHGPRVPRLAHVPTPPVVTSRRALLGGVASAGAAGVVAGTARPAQAAYRPRRYRGKPLLGAADRHLVNLLS